MKRNFKNLVVAGTVIILIGSAPITFAEEVGKPGQIPTGQKMESKRGGGFARELNLTPEQQEQLKQHREANQEKIKQLRQAMHAKRAELRAEIAKPNLDTAKVYSLASEIKSIFGQLLDLRIEGLIFMKRTLTPEQFEKFQQRINERKANKYGQKHRNRPQQNLETSGEGEGGFL